MPTVAEIDAQIRQLEEQKKQLQQKAKDAAVKKAEAAIDELRAMGFNYRLVETDRSLPRSSGTRRTGIREEVLGVVKRHGAQGVARAQILTALNASDKSGQQSVSNALAALKKAGSITADNGVYKAK